MIATYGESPRGIEGRAAGGRNLQLEESFEAKRHDAIGNVGGQKIKPAA